VSAGALEAPVAAAHDGNATGASGTSSEPVAPSSPDEPPAAILKNVLEVLHHELIHTPYQDLTAFLAFSFGLVLVFNGEIGFKGIVACAAFVVVGVTATNEVKDWDLSKISRIIVFLEAGAVGALSTYRGMAGMEIFLGALLGVFLAVQLLEWLSRHGLPSIEHRSWVVMTIFTILVLGSVSMFYKQKHVKLLVLLSAGIGSAFCTSALAFAATDCAVKGYLPLSSMFPDATPQEGTWVEFFEMFVSPMDSVDFGLFVGSRYNPLIEGKRYSLDRMLYFGVWFLVFLLGAVVQTRRLKAAAQARTAAALEEHLLPK